MKNAAKLYNRENARRFASTYVKIRREKDGEVIPVPADGIRRMQALPANVLACFASRPKSVRANVRVVDVRADRVTFRLGGAY
jgi:hypothetical protein